MKLILLLNFFLGLAFSLANAQSRSEVAIKPKSFNATVIILHGYTMNGRMQYNDMVGRGFKLLPYVKYWYPSAPGNSWFKIDWSGNFDYNLVDAAAAKLDGFIKQEQQAGINTKRIYVGGFSQGGGVTLHWAATRNTSLAGMIALSTWQPFELSNFTGNPSNRLFLAHGDRDSLLSLSMVQKGHNYARGKFSNCTYQIYRGLDHDVNRQEMADLSKFILDGLR